MADISPTLANVGLTGATPANTQYVQFGETVTQLHSVYLNADGKWYKADANNTALTAAAKGVVLTPAATNGYGLIVTDGKMNPGATLTVAADYYLSNTAGGICPRADLTSGASYVTRIGWAETASVLVVDIKAFGVLVP